MKQTETEMWFISVQIGAKKTKQKILGTVIRPPAVSQEFDRVQEFKTWG